MKGQLPCLPVKPLVVKGNSEFIHLMQMCILYCDPSLSSIQSGLKHTGLFPTENLVAGLILNMLSYQIFFLRMFCCFLEMGIVLAV